MLPPLGMLEVKHLYTAAIPLSSIKIFNIAPFDIWLLYCYTKNS